MSHRSKREIAPPTPQALPPNVPWWGGAVKPGVALPSLRLVKPWPYLPVALPSLRLVKPWPYLQVASPFPSSSLLVQPPVNRSSKEANDGVLLTQVGEEHLRCRIIHLVPRLPVWSLDGCCTNTRWPRQSKYIQRSIREVNKIVFFLLSLSNVCYYLFVHTTHMMAKAIRTHFSGKRN